MPPYPHTSHHHHSRGQSNYQTFPQSISSDNTPASIADDRQREEEEEERDDDISIPANAISIFMASEGERAHGEVDPPPTSPNPAHILVKAVFIFALISIVAGIAYIQAHDFLVSWLIPTVCSVLLVVCFSWIVALFRLAHLFAHRHDAPRQGDRRASQAINEDGFIQRLHESTLNTIRLRRQSLNALICFARLLTFALIILQPFIIQTGAHELYLHHGTQARKEHRRTQVDNLQMPLVQGTLLLPQWQVHFPIVKSGKEEAEITHFSRAIDSFSTTTTTTTITGHDISFKTDLAIFLLLILPLLLEFLLIVVLLDIHKMNRYLQWDLSMQEKRTSGLMANDDAPITMTPNSINESRASAPSPTIATAKSPFSPSSDTLFRQVYTELNDHDFFHSTNTAMGEQQMRRSNESREFDGNINGEGAAHFPAINDSPFLSDLNHHHHHRLPSAH